MPETTEGIGRYRALLLVAPVIWGAAFVLMKFAVDIVPPSTLIGVRFLLAAAVTALFCFRHIRTHFNREHLKVGLVLGVLYYLAYLTQTVGLTDTTPGKNAFLTATYCVMVPFIFWVIARVRPTVVNVGSAVVCLVGIGLVSLQGTLTLGFGDAMTLVCAFFFAVHIAYLGHRSRGCDIYMLTFLQFLVTGVLGIVFGLLTETQPSPDAITADLVWQIVFLAVVATFVTCLCQNIGQTKVPASQAGLLLSLESVFGVIFSVILYGETLTPQLVVGFVVIFAAIVVDGLTSQRMSKRVAEGIEPPR